MKNENYLKEHNCMKHIHIEDIRFSKENHASA